jgi:hypothetical protein
VRPRRTPGNPVDTLELVTTREKEEIPASWRDSVAEHLRIWVAKQPKDRRSQRALGDALGVSNFTYNRLKLKKGPLGLDAIDYARQ